MLARLTALIFRGTVGSHWCSSIAVAVGILILSFGGQIEASGPRENRPNIVVILSDDHGFADLSCQGIASDVRTPFIDSLAKNGARFTAAYVTAPQCSPSRAAILTGRYQQRFGLDEISKCPLPLNEVTFAERLQELGYQTGMVGKWHLSPNAVSLNWARENLPGIKVGRNGRVNIPVERALEFYPDKQGFGQYFTGEIQQYFVNYDLDKRVPSGEGRWKYVPGHRIDIQTQAAVRFIENNHQEPFFLLVGYFGPHVPLQATPDRLDRFPDAINQRRRYGLSMIAAIDDGVGQIVESLSTFDVLDNSLVFFTSDNGAPLKLTKPDDPIGQGGAIWDGSLNDPWLGEKGMLAEGGIRVPFVVQWPDRIPKEAVIDQPVSTLDIAATALSAVGVENVRELDGIDLLPILDESEESQSERPLFWRFWNQSAVRLGKWKYLRLGDSREFLFDLKSDPQESTNLISEQPEIARDLEEQLAEWTKGLEPDGMSDDRPNSQERAWYEHYFD
ncbi:Arylsulfatase [Thalassoglobus neptunius]|uniref:Arylsulfatase n=1 Tax=Thalassoglobus neptunius TaxID=1938619 RepID=A0A5C5VMZ7_9PLAN|nr:sulfatase-like hydrolase/transferase [Thalassoglobus neptunius]TWT39918.1 Arylsulfatase [Thalassoglobus neptunius]